MAETLVVAGSSTTATLVGAWELRAGSHDTTEHLARGSTYPGALGGFHPINSDAANGYDPAPKMALITLGSTTDGATVTLSGGASAILAVFTENGTANAGVAMGANFSGLVVTLETAGTVTAGQMLVMYN